MSKVVRVQEGDYKILLGKDGVPNNFVLDTNFGSFNGETGEVIINGNLVVTGNMPGPEVSNVMYVTMDGDDANDGKGEGPNRAKRTVKSAVEAAQEGTTIFVRSGEYYEDNPIRMPPKVSIIGDNLRRTILRPLNGPKKFNAVSISRTGGIVTVVTDVDNELKLHDRVRVIIPDSNDPTTRSSNIIDIECANIIEIVNTTTFKYKDSNPVNITVIPVGPATTVGTVELGVDFFLTTNQSYIAQMVFKGFQAPGYCINIDKDAIVDTSPYVQNCSNINGPWLRNGTEWLPFITEQPNLAGEMVKGPRPLRDDEIDPAQVAQYGINDRGAGGGMLIDGDRYNSESPIKSMVGDAFTQIAQGAIGFHITNFGYMQLVSCFAVFCDRAFYTTNGGYLSISNSVVDFGNYGFTADGYYPIPYATGVVTSAYYSKVGSITVNSEGSGYTGIPNATIQAPSTLPPNGIQATATVNLDSIRGTVNAVTPSDPGDGYTSVPLITIDPPFLPAVDWTANAAVSNGEYILYNLREYQVVGNGTLGATAPTHLAGTAVNGTVSLTLVGTQAKASVNLATNLTIRVDDISEKPQVASIIFIGNDPIGYYIKSTSDPNLAFRYNETKCRRDVGYIVDAVLSDAIFGTNFRSLYAARAYLRSYSSKVISLQKQQTLEALAVAKSDVVSRIGFIPSNGVDLAALFDLVISVINTGDPNIAVPTFPTPVGRTNGFVEAGAILQANKSYLQDQIIKYIDDTFRGFVYDSATCSRDIGMIVDAVSYDLATGSNFASVVAGSAYHRVQSAGVTGGQLPQTIAAIEHAKLLALTYVIDANLQTTVENLFNNVKNILENGLGFAPTLVFPDNGTSIPATVADGSTLRANIAAYKTSVSNYLNTNYNSVWTALGPAGQATCQRDVEYIVNAISYDVQYGGNYQSIIAGNAYYSFGTLQIAGTEKAATLAAYQHLKTIMQASAPSSALTVEGLVDDIITIINLGSSPTTTYPSVAGELQIVQESFAALQTGKTNIQNGVISYIDNTYNSFGYNEAKCSRDVGIIVNAVMDDLVLGSNYLSTVAGLSYLRSYANKVTEKQKSQTIAGINRARDLILKNLQDEFDSEVRIKQLFNIVTTIIRVGSNKAAPVLEYTDPISPTPAAILTEVKNNIIPARQQLIEGVISFINANLSPTTIVNYNESTCRRDVGYIVDAIAFDLLYGGNTATVNVANSFYTNNGESVVSTQIFEHLTAFNHLKSLLASVAPLTQTSAGFGYEGHADLLQIIIDAINVGQSSIPLVPTPAFYSRGSLYSYYADKRTKIDGMLTSIQADVIEYLNSAYKINFSYNDAKCRRDIAYIIDALTYDMIYGGNTQMTNAALAYSEGSVIAGEADQTVASYKYWQEIIPYVLQNIPVPNGIAGQVVNVNAGSPVPEYYPSTVAQSLLQIAIDVVDYGTGYVPEPVTEAEFDLGASDWLSFKNTVLADLVSVQDAVINYLNNTYGGNVNVTVYPGIINIPANTTVRLHNVSTISTGGTALEYVGSGVTYNALPFFGGEPIPEQERNESNNGRCFTVTNDQVGNFRVGSLFTVDALTGGVTIDAQNLNLGGISSIGPFKRNGIPVGVELKEVSNNAGLISSIGTKDINTVPTQYAVSTYVENRYLNKVQSSTLQTVESEVSFNNNVVVQGNLTVNGLTTTIESTSIVVEDPNITIGKNNTTDAQANGGGITLKGATDKTINWVDATDAWTLSENLNIANTKVYRISGTDVLSAGAVLDNAASVTAFNTATSVTIGSTTGTTTIRNANTVVTGDLAVNGGDLTTSQTTFNLLDTTATTVNFARAASVVIGSNATGSTTIRNASTIVSGDLEVNGGDLTTTQTTFNLLNNTATTVNAFGAGTNISIGSTAGTLTLNNQQTVFNSTDSIQIPVGTTGQRDSTPVTGQIRYNTTLSSFEGYGPGNTWGSLGGVKDVDGNTYIIPELSPGANDNTLWFYNNGVLTLNITQTGFNLSNGVIATLNDTTNTTATNNGSLVVKGGVGIALDLRVGGNEVITGDLAVNGGDLTTSQTTFNLLNNTATTVNAFGAASTILIGSSAGTLTVNNLQTIFNSTDSIQIPVGTTAQRDLTPTAGQIRYNTQLSTFEGFGPGGQWGSLGGVKDVDGNTYILAELTPAANDNTLWFYNNGVQTLTLTETNFDLKSPVQMKINNTTNSTTSATGALVVAGGVGVGNDIVGAGWTISSIQQFEIDEGTY